MKRKNATRSALFTSIISLLLCVSMLVGTTFAWFTDSVTSANNIIKSGNLDVVLEYWDGDSWEDVKDKSDILTNTLYEPGVTEIAYLRLANAGSLALKYQLGINIVSETLGKTKDNADIKLSDHIQFGVVEGVNGETSAYSKDAAGRAEAISDIGTAKKLNEGYTKPGSMNAGDELYLALVVYMPTTVGNEANHNGTNVPQIDLGINVFATQMEAESDSFGNDYDNGAYIPSAPEAIPEEGGTIVLNGSDESKVTVTVPAAVVNNLPDDVTSLSVQASAPVVDATQKTVSFTTVELVDQDGNEVDIAAAGGKVTVTLPVDGAFADGEQVEVYHDGAFVTYATVVGGKISYETSHFCEVEVKGAEAVVLDNTIDSVKEFMAFAAAVNGGKSYQGETVVLGADLDLAGVTWTPIGTADKPFQGTFDGNYKVIKNLSVLMPGKTNVGLFGNTTNGEIKNVTVENAKIAGRLNVGVVAGQPYTSKYTNITVKGHVEVDGMAYVGGVGGKNAYADWNDITVNVDATSYVNANSVENGKAYRTYVGGVVGFNGEGAHTFSNITSNINVIGSTIDVGGAFGIAHYNNKFKNITVTGTVTCNEETGEIGGIAGVWHNQTGTTVTFTNCKYEGKSTVSVVGSAYGEGTGALIIDGDTFASVAAGVIKNGDTYLICSADGLKWLANEVNKNGNSFQGMTVTLTDDIDLNSEAWTPIGRIGASSTDFTYTFKGTFDGQNHVIKNLNVSNTGWAGLFGLAHSATIQNVTVKGATIVSNRMAGAVVGQIYGSIENCHVEDVTITVTPNAVANGYDNGDKVGGIVGWLGDNGNNRTLIGCSATNVELKAYRDVGGIAGYVAFSTTVKNNEVSDVNITVDQSTNNYGAKDANAGAIVGRYADFSKTTVENNEEKNVVIAKAVFTADELVAALKAGGNAVLCADIDMASEALVIAKDVTLDLNGNVLSGTCNTSQDYLIMVNNGAELTVKDSSSAQTGKITFAQGDSNVGWTIDLEGVLNLYSGTIELTGNSWSIGYAVDVRPNAWGTAYTEGTVFHMYGGKVISSDGAIRVASSSSDTYKNVSASFIMDGGVVNAEWDGIFVQQSDAVYDTLSVEINGGSITSALAPIRVYGPVATSVVADTQKPMTITVDGGNLVMKGELASGTWYKEGKILLGGGMTVAALEQYTTITVN